MARLLKIISLSFLYTSICGQEFAHFFYFKDDILIEIVRQRNKSMPSITLLKTSSINKQFFFYLINGINGCRAAFVGLIKKDLRYNLMKIHQYYKVVIATDLEYLEVYTNNFSLISKEPL